MTEHHEHEIDLSAYVQRKELYSVIWRLIASVASALVVGLGILGGVFNYADSQIRHEMDLREELNKERSERQARNEQYIRSAIDRIADRLDRLSIAPPDIDVNQVVNINSEEAEKHKDKQHITVSELARIEDLTTRAIIYRLKAGKYEFKQDPKTGRYKIVNPYYEKASDVSTNKGDGGNKS